MELHVPPTDDSIINLVMDYQPTYEDRVHSLSKTQFLFLVNFTELEIIEYCYR